MFRFKQTGGPYGDETSSYDVLLEKKYTVRQFIDEVLSNKREWGYIGIHNTEKFSVFGYPYIEYRYGELTKDSVMFSEDILDANVDSCRASGGWTRMDYILDLKESEENK